MTEQKPATNDRVVITTTDAISAVAHFAATLLRPNDSSNRGGGGIQLNWSPPDQDYGRLTVGMICAPDCLDAEFRGGTGEELPTLYNLIGYCMTRGISFNAEREVYTDRGLRAGMYLLGEISRLLGCTAAVHDGMVRGGVPGYLAVWVSVLGEDDIGFVDFGPAALFIPGEGAEKAAPVVFISDGHPRYLELRGLCWYRGVEVEGEAEGDLHSMIPEGSA